MRLIDADALKSKIREQSWKQETKVSLMLDWIYMLIDEASTVSTVQNKALQQENEQLRAQVMRMRETLEKAREALANCIDALELCSHDELCKIAISPYDMIQDAKQALEEQGDRRWSMMNKHEIEKAIKILKVHSSHITDIKGVFNFEGGLTAKTRFDK